MHRHQADGIARVDRSVRLVSDGEFVEVLGHAGERGVAAVLKAAHHRAQLLQVLARLAVTGALQFARRYAVSARTRASSSEGDQPVHACEPARHRLAHRASTALSSSRRSAAASGSRTDDRGRESRRQPRNGEVREPNQTRPQERRRAQIGQRIGEIPEQRRRVLHFVGFEETRAPCRRT